MLQRAAWLLPIVLPVLFLAGCGSRALESIPEDQSLVTQDYLNAGLPPIDQPWSATDLQQAAAVLTALNSSRPGTLPRRESPRSGDVFRRITADDNFNHLRDTSISLDERITELLVHGPALNELAVLYNTAHSDKTVGGSEAIDLLGAQLDLVALQTELIGQDVALADANDPTLPLRNKGLQQMQYGITQMTHGHLVILTETHIYRLEERLRLLGKLQRNWPVTLPELPPDDQGRVLERVRELAGDSAMQGLRPELEALLVIAEEAVQRPATLRFGR